MLQVFRVKRIADGKCYALKQMSVQSMTPAERQGVMNEIRLLASLRSSNIIRYREAFSLSGDSICIVMENAPCGDLQAPPSCFPFVSLF